MRLIDADKLLDWYDRQGWDGVQAVVDMQPTIDAVPVVRCKDCKWCVDKHDGANCGHCICAERDVFANDTEAFEAVSLDDFCSSGERRTTDENQ